MAKKKYIQDGIVESVESTDDGSIVDSVDELRQAAGEALGQALDKHDDLIHEVIMAPPLFYPGEPLQFVALSLPFAVLYALIDPTYEGADVQRAERLGLLGAAVGELSPMGELVLAGTDRTALQHQIATAWRQAHNAAVEPSKAERP